MILFLGDLHLGRGSSAASRQAERDAVDLLNQSRAAMLEPDGGLVLLGDVFNAFMEYDTLIPAGFVRLQGAIAGLVDAGVRVHYVVGNRDPWHVSYFEREIGVEIVSGPLRLHAFGHRAVVTHGDEFAHSESRYQLMRPILRSNVAYWLYRHLLPADSGFRLARWVAARGRGEPEAPVVNDLRKAASDLLSTPDVDLVVMGHCHHAELSHHPGGTYLNAGYWFTDRTYGVLDANGPSLRRWAQSEHITPLTTDVQTP